MSKKRKPNYGKVKRAAARAAKKRDTSALWKSPCGSFIIKTRGILDAESLTKGYCSAVVLEESYFDKENHALANFMVVSRAKEIIWAQVSETPIHGKSIDEAMVDLGYAGTGEETASQKGTETLLGFLADHYEPKVVLATLTILEGMFQNVLKAEMETL